MTDADQRPTLTESAQAGDGAAREADGVVGTAGTPMAMPAVAPMPGARPDAVGTGADRSGAGPENTAGVGRGTDSASEGSTDAGAAAASGAASAAGTGPAESDNPFAPPPEDRPGALPARPQDSPWGAPAQSPWGTPPEQPYGEVRPGPVQPWGTERPRPPEQPSWGDPHRYGPVRDPRNDPDRRYRDVRETRPEQRPQRDLPTRWALGLSIGATICLVMAIYQGLVTFPAMMVGAGAGLVLAVAAFVMSIRAQSVATRRGLRTSDATASLVSSIVTGSLALILLVTSIVWFNQFRAYSKCMAGAGTAAAQEVCKQQLRDGTGMDIR